MAQNNKQENEIRTSFRSSGRVQDSLRFSADFNLQSDDAEIQFQFEDYKRQEISNQSLVSDENTKKNGVKEEPSRKLSIFNKYRQIRESIMNGGSQNVIESFDQIFNIETSSPQLIEKLGFKKNKNQEKQSVNENKDQTDTSKTKVISQTKNDNRIINNQNFEQEKDLFNDILNNSKNKQTQNNSQSNNQQIVRQQTFDPFRQSYINSNIQKSSQAQNERKQQIGNIFPSQIPVINETTNNQITKKQSEAQIKEDKNIKVIDSIKINDSSINDKSLPDNKEEKINELSNSNNIINKQEIQNDYSRINKQIENLNEEEKNKNVNKERNDTIDGNKWLLFPEMDQEQSVLPLLRKIHRLNSIYPNFSHPNWNQNPKLPSIQSLAQVFQKALETLQPLCRQIISLSQMPKLFPQTFFSVSSFTEPNWQVHPLRKQVLQQLDVIKPRDNFKRSRVEEDKIVKAISNYMNVVHYYKNKCIDLHTAQGQSWYTQARDKFWMIENNLKAICVDLYQLFINSDYPQFYYHYRNVLTDAVPQNKEQKLGYYLYVYEILNKNVMRDDRLSKNEVGKAVRTKIQNFIQRQSL